MELIILTTELNKKKIKYFSCWGNKYQSLFLPDALIVVDNIIKNISIKTRL